MQPEKKNSSEYQATGRQPVRCVLSEPKYSMPLTLKEIFAKYCPPSDDRTQRVEIINLARLGYIISLGEKSEMVSRAEETRKKKTAQYAYEPVYHHICKLFQKAEHIPGTPYGVLRSEFFQPHGTDGRLNAVGNISLQTTNRLVRHAITEDIYFDYDQVNAHPVFLLDFCRKNSIPRNALKNYVKNRETLIADIMKLNPGLTRDGVKQALLSLLNGGKADYLAIKNKTPALEAFRKEIAEIIQKVAEKNPALLKEIMAKRKKEGKDFNHEGALMCRVLQKMENQALTIMESVFMEHGVPLTAMVPIHDGMMTPEIQDDDEVIRQCVDTINEQMDLEIAICTKDLNAHKAFNFSEADEPENWARFCNKEKILNVPVGCDDFIQSGNLYDMTMKYKNEIFGDIDSLGDSVADCVGDTVRMVQYPPCYLINKGRIGDEECVVDIESEVNTHFYYMQEQGKNTVEKRASFKQLLDLCPVVSRKLPVYKSITFNPDPSKDDPSVYNSFRGMKAQTIPSDRIRPELFQPILDHILTCWCDGDKNIYDYVLHWLRRAFLKPWEKTGVVILLFGQEGTGKGILLDEFIRPFIYGMRNSLTVQGLSKIVQRFNTAIMNKLLICANEVNSNEGFHETFEILKALITDKTFCPEKKGIDPIQDYPIPCNFVFTTNNHDSVKLGRTDRRYLCLHTSSVHKGNFDYFEKLAECFTQEVADHFYSWVMLLPKTRKLRDIPTTKLKLEMLRHTISSVELFYNDLVRLFQDSKEDNIRSYLMPWQRHILDYSETMEGEATVPASQLYQGYKYWCGDNTERIKSHRDFGNEIKNFVKPKKTSTRNTYVIIYSEGEVIPDESDIEDDDF
jgi:hypothetical protein